MQPRAVSTVTLSWTVSRNGEVNRVQVLYYPLGYLFRNAVAHRPESRQRAVGIVFRTVKRRHVKALKGRGLFQKPAPAQPLPAAFLVQRNKLRQRILALAYRKDVKKVRHRLGIIGTRSAADYQRVVLAPVRRERGDTGKRKHVHHVGIAQLVLQRERHDVELVQRVAAFKRIKLCAGAPQLALHIRPGGKAALAGNAVHTVENAGEDLHAQVGHAYFIRVREAEAYPRARVLLERLAELAARISARLFNAAQQLFVSVGLHRLPPNIFLRY